MSGRPRKPATERRTNIFHLPLTAEERQVLEAAARQAGGTLAGWSRMVLLAAARRVERADDPPKE